VSDCVKINVETMFMPREIEIETVDRKVRIEVGVFSLENNLHKTAVNGCQSDEYYDTIKRI
jgi:hypothetical protein